MPVLSLQRISRHLCLDYGDINQWLTFNGWGSLFDAHSSQWELSCVPEKLAVLSVMEESGLQLETIVEAYATDCIERDKATTLGGFEPAHRQLASEAHTSQLPIANTLDSLIFYLLRSRHFAAMEMVQRCPSLCHRAGHLTRPLPN